MILIIFPGLAACGRASYYYSGVGGWSRLASVQNERIWVIFDDFPGLSRLGAIYRCDYSVYDRRRHHGWVWLDDIFILQKKIIEKSFRKNIFRPKKKLKKYIWEKNRKVENVEILVFCIQKIDISKFSTFQLFFRKIFFDFLFRPKNIFSKTIFDQIFYKMKISSNHTRPWCLRGSCTE